MCRTIHAVLQTVICGIQMLVRVFMTVILMIENLIRMILQTAYNFISFLLQMLSLIPICIVFLLTARLKCFMCGGGGPCPVNRGGACDCIMSAMAILIMFFIFRATGTLDKIFYSLGYAKARVRVDRFVPTQGDITECSRNDSEYTEETSTLNETYRLTDMFTSTYDTSKLMEDYDKSTITSTTNTTATVTVNSTGTTNTTNALFGNDSNDMFDNFTSTIVDHSDLSTMTTTVSTLTTTVTYEPQSLNSTVAYDNLTSSNINTTTENSIWTQSLQF